MTTLSNLKTQIASVKFAKGVIKLGATTAAAALGHPIEGALIVNGALPLLENWVDQQSKSEPSSPSYLALQSVRTDEDILQFFGNQPVTSHSSGRLHILLQTSRLFAPGTEERDAFYRNALTVVIENWGQHHRALRLLVAVICGSPGDLKQNPDQLDKIESLCRGTLLSEDPKLIPMVETLCYILKLCGRNEVYRMYLERCISSRWWSNHDYKEFVTFYGDADFGFTDIQLALHSSNRVELVRGHDIGRCIEHIRQLPGNERGSEYIADIASKAISTLRSDDALLRTAESVFRSVKGAQLSD